MSGIRKDIQTDEYTIPDKLQMRPLDDFIIDKTIYNTPISNSLQKNLDKIRVHADNNNIIMTPFTYYYVIYNVSPTLTTQCSKFYLTKYKRRIYLSECLSLQGFPINFIQVISNNQMYKQIGNSMSVNVLRCLFVKIFSITDITVN